MLLGLVFTLITELLFGFSQNFAWAVSARLLWGLLNGNLGVAKTYISEVRTPVHHTTHTLIMLNDVVVIDVGYVVYKVAFLGTFVRVSELRNSYYCMMQQVQ